METAEGAGGCVGAARGKKEGACSPMEASWLMLRREGLCSEAGLKSKGQRSTQRMCDIYRR